MGYGSYRAARGVVTLGALDIFGVVYMIFWTVGFIMLTTWIIGSWIVIKIAELVFRRSIQRRERERLPRPEPELTPARLRARARMLEGAPEPAQMIQPDPYDMTGRLLEKVPPAPAPATQADVQLSVLPPPAPAAADDGAGREMLIGDLFAVPCRTCREKLGNSLAGQPCAMGMGIPVAIVRKNPLTFCHFSRMQDAVAEGLADRDDVIAQFGGRFPESVVL